MVESGSFIFISIFHSYIHIIPYQCDLSPFYLLSHFFVINPIGCINYICRASLEPKDHKAPLENWLRNIRDTYRLHKEELNVPELQNDPIKLQRKLVELNVVEQCLNIFKTAVVQKRRVDTFSQIGLDG